MEEKHSSTFGSHLETIVPFRTDVCAANLHISRVEPRGFEPLASAEQSRNPSVVDVRPCS